MFKMTASAQEKAFCVPECAKTTSLSSVQRHFRTRYGKNPPTRKSIYDWYKQLQGEGCVCKGKSTRRPQVTWLPPGCAPEPECHPPTTMDWTCCERKSAFAEMPPPPHIDGSDTVWLLFVGLHEGCCVCTPVANWYRWSEAVHHWGCCCCYLWRTATSVRRAGLSIWHLSRHTWGSHWVLVRCEKNFESSPFILYIARRHMVNSTCKINFWKCILLYE
jgi:hypothetical protein